MRRNYKGKKSNLVVRPRRKETTERMIKRFNKKVKKLGIIDEIKERLLSFEGNIIDIDGIRVETEEGWFLMRASNTQNQLTCRVESTSKNGLKKLIDIVENQLQLSNVNFKFTI